MPKNKDDPEKKRKKKKKKLATAGKNTRKTPTSLIEDKSTETGLNETDINTRMDADDIPTVKPPKSNSSINSMSKDIRRKIKFRNKKFRKLLKNNEPTINKDEIIFKFEEVSQRTRDALLEYIMKTLGILNATHYVNSALVSILGGNETQLNINEIDINLKKLLRIKLLKIILEEYRLTGDEKALIVNNFIHSQFKTPISTNMPPVNSKTTPSSKETYRDAIENFKRQKKSRSKKVGKKEEPVQIFGITE